MRSVKQLKNFKNKSVLLRVDFNVPLEKKKVVDDTRIKAAMPTILYLLKEKAKVILITHLGRPKGKVVASLRVAPIVRRLSVLIGKKVRYLPFSTGKKVQTAITALKPGEILFLENIQFEPGETENDAQLAQVLASYADYYVTDNFAQAHRAYASIVGVPKYLPSYAGLLLQKEINALDTLLKKPKHPFVGVLGGAKIETKIPIMKHVVPKVNYLLLGGGLVNTYLLAKGYGVGDSLTDPEYARQALIYCGNKKVVTPLDVVVGKRDGSVYAVVDIQKKPHEICGDGYGIFDIGPRTIALFSSIITKARTLVWNGAMGYFEQKPYDVGTLSIARLVATQSKNGAFGVIGGGETLQAMEKTRMGRHLDLVSTGGAAMLDYLSGQKLPGIEVLKK